MTKHSRLNNDKNRLLVLITEFFFNIVIKQERHGFTPVHNTYLRRSRYIEKCRACFDIIFIFNKTGRAVQMARNYNGYEFTLLTHSPNRFRKKQEHDIDCPLLRNRLDRTILLEPIALGHRGFSVFPSQVRPGLRIISNPQTSNVWDIRVRLSRVPTPEITTRPCVLDYGGYRVMNED